MESKTIIELFVPDLEKTIKWYERIGFKVWSHMPDERYAILDFQGNKINFYGTEEIIKKHSWFGKFPFDTPVGYRSEIALTVNDIDKAYKIVSEVCRENIVRELRMRPWNAKDFRIHDLWGFYLRFTEPVTWKI